MKSPPLDPEVGGDWETFAEHSLCPGSWVGLLLLPGGGWSSTWLTCFCTLVPSRGQRATGDQEHWFWGEAGGWGGPPRHSSSPVTLGSVTVNSQSSQLEGGV